MTSFRARRLLWFSVSLLAAVGLAVAWHVGYLALRPVATYSGLLLLGLILGLGLFNARKQLPFLPLLKASTWMQVHIYVGWVTVLVYLLHVGLRWPSGRLGLALGTLFFWVTASGILGLWLSRWLPSRMTRSGESLIYERIPTLRHRLQTEAKEIVRKAASETQSTTLPDYFQRVLGDYLASTPGLLLPLMADDARHHRVMAELRGLRRYLDTREVPFADQLEEIIEAKRNLDAQYGGQRLLKVWLFVHVPLSYALIVLSFVHAWLVLRYAGRF